MKKYSKETEKFVKDFVKRELDDLRVDEIFLELLADDTEVIISGEKELVEHGSYFVNSRTNGVKANPVQKRIDKARDRRYKTINKLIMLAKKAKKLQYSYPYKGLTDEQIPGLELMYLEDPAKWGKEYPGIDYPVELVARLKEKEILL